MAVRCAVDKKRVGRRKYRILTDNSHSQSKANGSSADTGAEAERL